MSEKNRNREIADLLKAIGKRELTPEEWDVLSSAAADDPFLLDALEGLKLLPLEQRRQQLESLGGRIQELLKVERNKSVVFYRIAAVGLLLVVSTFLIRQWTRTGATMEVASAKTEKLEHEGDDVFIPSFPSDTQALINDLLVESSDPATEDIEQGGTVVLNSSSTGESPPAVKWELYQEKGWVDLQAESVGNDSLQSRPALAIDASAFDRAKEAHSNPEPIIAYYQSAETNTGNETDQGLTDSPQVERAVRQGAEILTNAAMEKSESSFPKNYGPKYQSYATALPKDGWKSYYRYIRINLELPDAAVNNGIEGTVHLEFDIDENGRPYEILVTESLGFGCDEEAIRLLQEGPDWDISNAQVPKGRLTVDF